jgi:ABC-type multidrug transport system ATPase subunit
VSQGATVVLSSHELDRAEKLADRVVELVGGTIASPKLRSSDRQERSDERQMEDLEGEGASHVA